MSKQRVALFGLLALVCVIGIPWVALGKQGDQGAATVKVASQDMASKDLFATNCGTCHTLAAGGTDGVVGPDLDQLLVPSGTNSAQSINGNTAHVYSESMPGCSLIDVGNRKVRHTGWPYAADERSQCQANMTGFGPLRRPDRQGPGRRHRRRQAARTAHLLSEKSLSQASFAPAKGCLRMHISDRLTLRFFI